MSVRGVFRFSTINTDDGAKNNFKGGRTEGGAKNEYHHHQHYQKRRGKIRVPENTGHFTTEHRSRKPRKVEFRRKKKKWSRLG